MVNNNYFFKLLIVLKPKMFPTIGMKLRFSEWVTSVAFRVSSKRIAKEKDLPPPTPVKDFPMMLFWSPHVPVNSLLPYKHNKLIDSKRSTLLESYFSLSSSGPLRRKYVYVFQRKNPPTMENNYSRYLLHFLEQALYSPVCLAPLQFTRQ